MKLVLERVESGRTALYLKPTQPKDVVAFPRALLLDGRVDSAPPDRLWTSAALFFGPRLRAREMEAPLITPLMEAAIKDFHPEVRSSGFRSTANAFQSTGQGNTFVLEREDSDAVPVQRDNGGRVVGLRFLPMPNFVGGLFSMSRTVMATNAVSPGGVLRVSDLAPAIAAAVLMAADFAVDHLVIPVGGLRREQEWEYRLETLLENCSIAVDFVGGDSRVYSSQEEVK